MKERRSTSDHIVTLRHPRDSRCHVSTVRCVLSAGAMHMDEWVTTEGSGSELSFVLTIDVPSQDHIVIVIADETRGGH